MEGRAARAARRPASWWSATTRRVVDSAGHAAGYLPGASRAGRSLVGALGRLIDAGAGTAAASVRTDPIVARYRGGGLAVDDLTAIQDLPLTEIRRVIPQLRASYAVVGGVQGAGSSLLASSATVLGVAGAVGTAGVAAGPGLGIVLTTMVLDAAAGVLVSERAVAHVAAYHGYDVADPQERLFALGVLSLGLAEDSRRAAAYSELTGIARGLARRQAWRLTSAQARTVVGTVSASLALRLTEERLADLVPVVGTVIAVRRGARSLAQVVDDAEHLYAERLLRERYDLPPDDGADEQGEILSALDDELTSASGG